MTLLSNRTTFNLFFNLFSTSDANCLHGHSINCMIALNKVIFNILLIQRAGINPTLEKLKDFYCTLLGWSFLAIVYTSKVIYLLNGNFVLNPFSKTKTSNIYCRIETLKHLSVNAPPLSSFLHLTNYQYRAKYGN